MDGPMTAPKPEARNAPAIRDAVVTAQATDGPDRPVMTLVGLG